MPYQPSTEELTQARRHVKYELDMLRAVVGELQSDRYLIRDPSVTVIRNALLESALVHARNLLDFFTKEPFKRDVIAGHFVQVDGAYWKSTKYSVLPALRDDLNGALQHITYTRFGRKINWPLDLILNETDSAFEEFRAAMSDAERELWQA